MTELATKEQVELMKRTEIRVYLAEKLVGMGPAYGLAIAMGVLIELAKRHGFPLWKLKECIDKTWDTWDEA